MPWLSTAQATHRLGVKPTTLYAYVSRGLLTSHRDPATGHSRFETSEVEQLARRGRPRQASRARSLDLQIDTAITEIGDHRIHYRGHDAIQLAGSATFEQVAMLLWTGELPPPGDTWPSGSADAAALGSNEMRITDCLRIVLAFDALHSRRHRDTPTVIDEGRHLVATFADALPRVNTAQVPRLAMADGSKLRDTIAGRLWVRLSPRRANAEMLGALNAALVLLADHEMAASTLAARVAASTRAGVHDVVAAGMGALHGPLHGGESRRVRRVLADARRTSPAEAVERALEHLGRLPGFGQALYPDGDPRAVFLLAQLDGAGAHPALDTVHEVIEEAARRRLPHPNVDLALGALGLRTDMPDDAGAAIFTTARTVGWLAHAMEEYEEPPLRFRPRAVYVGPTATQG